MQCTTNKINAFGTVKLKSFQAKKLLTSIDKFRKIVLSFDE